MNSSEKIQFVVFSMDGQRYALRMSAVERVVRAVELTPLPSSPEIVLGVIDIAGSVIPVLDLRHRFGLPQMPISPTDQILIAQTSTRRVALVVDEAHGVIEYPESAIVASSRIIPGLEQIQGLAILDDGLVLIHDLEKCLSLDEERELASAMDQDATRGS